MITKRISILAFLLLSGNIVLPQPVDLNSQIFLKKNSINLEVGGYSVFGSVYYERVIVNKPRFKSVAQIGYSILGSPIGLHGIISSNQHHFEFGSCVVVPLFCYNSGSSYVTGRLGYRFQKPEGKFIFRAGLMPVFVGPQSDPDIILWVWPGFSFGRAF